MPPWGRTHGIRQPGRPANTGPQTRRTGHGPRDKKPRPTHQEPPPGAGRFTHSPPYITRSLITDTSRRSGNTPSLTLCSWPSSTGPRGLIT
jgi:hypothetical protein